MRPTEDELMELGEGGGSPMVGTGKAGMGRLGGACTQKEMFNIVETSFVLVLAWGFWFRSQRNS